MTDSTDLKPCPLCEGTNIQHQPGQLIACMNINCGCQVEMGSPWGGPKEDGIAFLVAAWNRRPSPPPVGEGGNMGDEPSSNPSVSASPAADGWTRETLGRAIYLGLYEHQGAKWEANDSKEVWYTCADRVLARASFAPKVTDIADALRLGALSMWWLARAKVGNLEESLQEGLMTDAGLTAADRTAMGHQLEALGVCGEDIFCEEPEAAFTYASYMLPEPDRSRLKALLSSAAGQSLTSKSEDGSSQQNSTTPASREEMERDLTRGSAQEAIDFVVSQEGLGVSCESGFYFLVSWRAGDERGDALYPKFIAWLTAHRAALSSSQGEGKRPELCDSPDPYEQCDGCDCWKLTREMCS